MGKILKLTLYPIFLLTLFSCGQAPSDVKFYEVDKSDFDHVINSKRMPAKPDLANYKTLLNRDYPIEIALFDNGDFYYDLPNLGDGKGKWKYENGGIKLEAQRDLFDMEISVHALKENASEIGLEFFDRFGRNLISVEKINTNKN